MTMIAQRNRPKVFVLSTAQGGGSLELPWNAYKVQVQRIRCVATTVVNHLVSSFIVIGECDFAQAIA
jgi:hypothetical protein